MDIQRIEQIDLMIASLLDEKNQLEIEQKERKFRHIHRYSFVDIGNRPWIYKSIYDLLTEPAKDCVQKKNGYIISDYLTSSQILRMLKIRCGKSNIMERIIVKKTPDRGIRVLDQVPASALKRVPFWKEK